MINCATPSDWRIAGNTVDESEGVDMWDSQRHPTFRVAPLPGPVSPLWIH